MTDVSTKDLTSADFAPTPVVIATGASPVTADPNIRAYAVTTGGTAGAETIDIPNFTPAIDDYISPLLIGQRILIYIGVQTDPGDTVRITAGGSGHVQLYNANTYSNAETQSTANGVVLAALGECACFVWTGTNWNFDQALSGHNDETTDFDGATVLFYGLHVTQDVIQMVNLPTTDPNNAFQLWNDGGVLTISAG